MEAIKAKIAPVQSKLGLDRTLVDQARASAARVAEDTQRFIEAHTTVAVERTVCRLLGIDGVNGVEVPLPNVVVEHLSDRDILGDGAALRVGNAMAELGLTPQEIAEGIDRGEIDLAALPNHSEAEIRAALAPVVDATMARIRANVKSATST
jgi:beta-lysine 5,6-aminomutase alpha subunit